MSKLILKTQWDEKFVREHPFMAFGSMMNAFGKIHHGKGMKMVEFELAAKQMWNLAKEFTVDAFSMVERSEGMDVPMRQK